MVPPVHKKCVVGNCNQWRRPNFKTCHNHGAQICQAVGCMKSAQGVSSSRYDPNTMCAQCMTDRKTFHGVKWYWVLKNVVGMSAKQWYALYKDEERDIKADLIWDIVKPYGRNFSKHGKEMKIKYISTRQLVAL